MIQEEFNAPHHHPDTHTPTHKNTPCFSALPEASLLNSPQSRKGEKWEGTSSPAKNATMAPGWTSQSVHTHMYVSYSQPVGQGPP